MNKYFIHHLYNERKNEHYFNDINNKDEWQDEVYSYANNFLKNIILTQ
jgi:hypothetical protein